MEAFIEDKNETPTKQVSEGFKDLSAGSRTWTNSLAAGQRGAAAVIICSMHGPGSGW